MKKKLKVVLINPPQFAKYAQPPMGLSLIAAILEREGYQVGVVDANALKLTTEDIFSYVTDADVVGLTAMTPTINTAINIANQIKQVNPNLITILGGPHATLLPTETLINAPGIDIIVRGEGEKTIIKLLKVLEHNQPLDNISGISYREDGEVINSPISSISTNTDLDSLPFFAYHLLPWNRYRPHPPHGRALPFAAVITSRGCPYRCSYCSNPIFGYKFRAQSSERVVEEIAYYERKFDIKEVAFYDDVFTMDKKRAYMIADNMMKKGLRIHWTCETRVNLIDKELLHHMKQAGCYAIAYGIESASQKILDILNKGITLEQMEEAVSLAREVGLQTIGYFMVGSPGESLGTIANTIQFAKKLRLDFAQFGITIPFPGTKLYDLYLKDRGNGISWDSFTYERLDGKTVPVFESDRLSRVDLQRWIKRAYKEFYLRPVYLWQRIQRTASVGDIRVNLEGFSVLIRSIFSANKKD